MIQHDVSYNLRESLDTVAAFQFQLWQFQLMCVTAALICPVIPKISREKHPWSFGKHIYHVSYKPFNAGINPSAQR
jgi:hypothetical protein